MVRKRRLQGN